MLLVGAIRPGHDIATRFGTGQMREVRLIPYRGARKTFGFNSKVMETLD